MSKLSNDPQNVKPGVWYYENPGSIDIYLNFSEFSDAAGVHQDSKGNIVGAHIRIPSRLLRKTIERQSK